MYPPTLQSSWVNLLRPLWLSHSGQNLLMFINVLLMLTKMLQRITIASPRGATRHSITDVLLNPAMSSPAHTTAFHSIVKSLPPQWRGRWIPPLVFYQPRSTLQSGLIPTFWQLLRDWCTTSIISCNGVNAILWCLPSSNNQFAYLTNPFTRSYRSSR